MLVEVRKPFKAPHKIVQVGERFHAEDLTARDWIRNGLVVDCKSARTPQNKMKAPPIGERFQQLIENKTADAGKAPAVGEAQLSSVSQAAQVSQQTTVPQSETGEKRPTLRLRKPRAKRSQSTQHSE